MKLTDWYLQRNTLSIQRLASVISLVLSGVAIAVSIAALLLKSGN